jgi:hypothetical protein
MSGGHNLQYLSVTLTGAILKIVSTNNAAFILRLYSMAEKTEEKNPARPRAALRDSIQRPEMPSRLL